MQYQIPTNAGQRSIADIIENAIIEEYVAKGGIKPKSVRTIEDVTYDNKLIDIKTRDVGRDFSMPNLISVNRLMKNKDKHIEYKIVEYKVEGDRAIVMNIIDRPIHSICWSAMKIQNLGLGQLQLVKHTNIPVFRGSKDEWYERLQVEMNLFSKKQITKFTKLIKE